MQMGDDVDNWASELCRNEHKLAIYSDLVFSRGLL